MDELNLKVIARIHTDFPDKFGIPRQSGLVEQLSATVVFEPEYRAAEALRGIEEYSHIWLLWGFSRSAAEGWSPTVRPPKLGGNRREGVFATRSPFRPNPIGLSCVKLEGVEKTENGNTLKVRGADLMDGTPIYDIKPYIPYTDAHPEADGGFSVSQAKLLEVNFPAELLDKVAEDKREALIGVLAADPRPAYIDDPQRVFGFEFAKMSVKFRVEDSLLTVIDIYCS